MSKAVSVVMVISLITFGVMYFYWPYLKIVFATSAYYTEKDKAEYVFIRRIYSKRCRILLMIILTNTEV